jgi:REP element-mobilizing transposase RayT
MVQYRRNFVPGGTYFFTVTLADRTSSALLDHIGILRSAFRITRHERPFTIDAIVILPDHLHTLWTLPPGDSDFPGRWKRIKAHFTHRLVATDVAVKRHRNVNILSGNAASGNTRFETRLISNGMSTTYTSIPSNTAWSAVRRVGRTRRFTLTCGAVRCQQPGQAMLTSR